MIIVQDTFDINSTYKNPFKWKGYYYDEETNLFWCNSRYYNPEWGRFIQPADVSALNTSSINGLNLYSYANNNPIGIAYSSYSVGGSSSGGMVSLVKTITSIEYINSNNISITLPRQNWWTTGADFIASMAGALSVIRWTSKNPQFFEFFNYNYGITKHQLLNNLKTPLVITAKIFSYLIVGYETYVDIKEHVAAGDSWQTTIASGIVTAGVGALNVWAAGKIGAAIGGIIGGVPGFIVGTIIGAGVGVVINGIFYTKINDKSISGYIENGIEELLEWLF